MTKYFLGLILGLSLMGALSFGQNLSRPSDDCCTTRETTVKQANSINSTNHKAEERYRKQILGSLPQSAVTKEDVRKAVCGDDVSPRSTQLQAQINEARSLAQPIRATEWLNFSGWQLKTTVKFGHSATDASASKLQCIFSKYAAESPNKDFAETVKLYRFKPTVLQTQCPEKYNYLRDHVFNGKEFNDPNRCGA